MPADDFKKKFFWEIGIGGGVSILLIIIHLFVNADIKGRVGSITGMRSQAASQSRTIESLVRLKESAERASGYLSIFDRILPNQEQLFDFRTDVRSVAEAQGVEMSFNFGQQTPSSDDAPGFTAFQMTARGVKSSFVPFLRGIESHEHFVSVDSIDITTSGDTFTANLGGRVFSR